MRARNTESGFSLVELMVVVLIIGVLVAIGVAVFGGSTEKAQQRACFSNQRIIEGAAQAYSSQNDEDLSGLVGVVTGTHPLINDYIFRTPPRCPSAPQPADPANVTVATGAYTLDGNGNVDACTHGSPAHGRFR